MGFGVWGLGFGVWCLGFGVWGLGLGFGALGLGLGFRAFGRRLQGCLVFEYIRVYIQDSGCQNDGPFLIYNTAPII